MLHIFIGCFIKSFWIDAVLGKFFHPEIHDLSEVFHLLFIIDQGKCNLLLISAVWCICQQIKHLVYQVRFDIFVLKPSAGVPVRKDGI